MEHLLHMKYALIFLLIMAVKDPLILFDNSNKEDLSNWMIVDDVVMGGRSDGQFYITENGQGIFEGFVSTENYGGFSSVRLNCKQINVEGYTKAVLTLKGDGKTYQLRTKSNPYDRHSYVKSFTTSGQREIIEIALTEMEPRFRGRQLRMPNYPAQNLSELAILIGNKKNESFRLEIEQIVLK